MEFILEWVGRSGTAHDNNPENYQLWACRGEKKGCKKRIHKTKRHCADCVLPDENSTLEQVQKMLERGDA